jgi:hypothetical protein
MNGYICSAETVGRLCTTSTTATYET